MSETSTTPVRIRRFEERDAEVCHRLYEEGRADGRTAENDTGLDIDDIPAAYLSAPGGNFWVAENDQGEVVGMIGVQLREEGEAEIRRLRVRPDHRRRGIGTRLLEMAVRFCQEQGYLKIVLDTAADRDPALRLFEKFRFKLSRTRNLAGREMLYFYLDLYSGPRRTT